MSDPIAETDLVEDCAHCGKPLPLCICDSITPIESRTQLLILVHPQEQDRALGTARLLARHFEDAVVRIGLSWPSLSKALGRPVPDPSRWAVLYLGSAKVEDLDTDAEIVSQNQEDGAVTTGTRKTVTWKATPTTKDAPTAVLRFK